MKEEPPDPPFATGKTPVTFAVKSILPASIAFVIPEAFTLSVSLFISIEESSTVTDKVVPD